jgi:RHS repeat-associated protein
MKQSIEEKAGFLEHAPGAIVLSQKDFNRALKNARFSISDDKDTISKPAYAADYGTKLKATEFAAAANDPATLGIVGSAKYSDKPFSFAGNIFFVVDDAAVNRSSKKLEVSNYKIVAIELSGTANFMGTDIHFAQVDSMRSGGGRRCCGPSTLCTPKGPSIDGVHSPLPMEATYSRNNLWDVREATGRPTIGLDLYTPSLKDPQTGLPTYVDPDLSPTGVDCIRTHDPGCTNKTPICDVDMPGFSEDDGTPTIDQGSNPCGPITKPVNIPKVPKWCTFAYTLDNCGGRFPNDYDQPYNVRTSLPPLCTVAKPVSPEGICGESYEVSQGKKQGELQARAGWIPGQRTRVCTPVSGGLPGLLTCVECDAKGECKETLDRIRSERDYTPTKEDAIDYNSGFIVASGNDSTQEFINIKEESGSGGFPLGPNPLISSADGEIYFDEDMGTNGLDFTSPTPPVKDPPEAASGRPPIGTDVVFDKPMIIVGEVKRTSPPPPVKDSPEPTHGRPPRELTDKPATPAVTTPTTKPNKPKTRSVEADPVKLSDGSLVISHTDLSFKGPTRDFEFVRRYQSSWTKRSPLGSNWTHNWDVCIEPLNADNTPDWLSPWCAGAPGVITAVFVHDGGSMDLYLLDIKTQLYLPHAGAFGTLSRTVDNGWALRDPDGRIRIFDADGDLVSDRDRFGNGFAILYEPTPLFRLYSEFCSESELLRRNETKYSRRNKMLAYLVGDAPRPGWDPSEWEISSLDFPLQEDQIDLIYGRDLLLHLIAIAKANGGIVDRVDGPRKKRPIQIQDDTGRTLELTYYKATRLPIATSPIPKKLFNFAASPWAELLQQVDGPVGTQVLFNYSLTATHPAELNARFLARVNRQDTGTAQVASSLSRWYEFEYNAVSEKLLKLFSNKVEEAYKEYYSTFMGCAYFEQYNCNFTPVFSSLKIAGGNPTFYALLQRNQFISEVSGWISMVTNTDTIESETRYVPDPWDSNFGRAIAQRWGALATQPSGSFDPDSPGDRWKTNLPKATFQYQDAGPDGRGGDLTDKFLPPALARRYPLEMNTSDTKKEVIPPVVVGADKTKHDHGCDYQRMEVLRKSLPGYREYLPYYQLPPEEQHPNINLPLKRTLLTPAQLIHAQVGDPTHNDLISGVVKDPSGTSDYVFERILGRRKLMAANGNRICSWIRYRDRDGDVHYYGLNYRGQALVDAVQEKNGEFIITERLVNADGHVVQERTPMRIGEKWNVIKGYKAFVYDEINPSGNRGWNEWLPVFWSRRSNLIRIEEHAIGGFVMNSDESGNTENHLGRFQFFAYEPLFNQMNIHLAGTIEKRVVKPYGFFVHSYTSLIYDYQELSFGVEPDEPGTIVPVLESLVPWGFDWMRNKNGEIDESIVGTWQLPVELFGKDLNGDGERGNRFANAPKNRALGVPILIQKGGKNDQTVRTTKIGWAPHGKPSFIVDSDGELTIFEYYSLSNTPPNIYGGTDVPTNTDVNSGYRGFLGRVKRLRSRSSYNESYGPSESPKPLLKGPYQWINVPGVNIRSEFQTMGFPVEVIDDLLASVGAYPASENDFERREFTYDQTGSIIKFFATTGNMQVKHDCDGLVVEVIDSIGTRTDIGYDYQGLPESIRKFDQASTAVGELLKSYDAEGRVLHECYALEKDGCYSADATKSVKRSFTYSPEGSFLEQVEPSGLTITHRYNSRKQLLGTVQHDKRQASSPWRGVAYRYDLHGRIKEIRYGVKNDIDVPLQKEKMTYDGLGRIATQTDKRGITWKHVWSYRDKLVIKEDLGSNQPMLRETFAYDGLGEQVAHCTNGILVESLKRTVGGKVYLTTGEGRGDSWQTYDALGRIAWMRDAAGTETIYTYRESPNRNTVTRISRNSAGGVLVKSELKEFDSRGLPILEKAFGDGVYINAAFEFDANGYLFKQRDHFSHEKRYFRNWLGWVTSFQEDRGNGTNQFDEAQYFYNLQSRVKSLLDPTGYRTQWEYNIFGDLASQTSEGAHVSVTSSFAYDHIARLTEQRNGSISYKTLFNKVGDAYEEQYWDDFRNKWSPLVLRKFDKLGRATQLSHFNPSLDYIAESERMIVTERDYDSLGRIRNEKMYLDNVLLFSSNSRWDVHAGGWKRDSYFQARQWASSRSEQFDGAGRMIRLQRSSAQTPGSNTYFNWQGEHYAGRSQYHQSSQSPFRESIEIDSFGAPHKIVFQAIDIDSSRHPLNSTEGTIYCPGGWDVASCGKPLLEIDLMRDAIGRVASLQWQFNHPQMIGGVLQAPSHPIFWRGYAYTLRGHLSSVWEHQGSGINTNNLQNYRVAESNIQTLGASSTKWIYNREAAVGGTTSIVNSTNSATRFRLPSPRGKGHQLTQVEANGTISNVRHDARGQIIQNGSDQFVYHPLGQLAFVIKQGKIAESYLYDAEGRLVGVLDSQNNRTNILFDGHQMIAATSQQGQPLWEAAWGPGIDKLVEWIDLPNRKTYAPLADHRNSVVGLWDVTTKRMHAIADYSPEGKAQILSPTYQTQCDEESAGAQSCLISPHCNFMFGSLWKSDVTGLVWMRNRWYESQLNQFLLVDKLGTVDSFNLYSYVNFDPINFTDPLGLSSDGFVSGINDFLNKAGDLLDLLKNRKPFQLEKRSADFLKEAKDGLKKIPRPKPPKGGKDRAFKLKERDYKNALRPLKQQLKRAQKLAARVEKFNETLMAVGAVTSFYAQGEKSTAITETGKILDAVIGGAGVSLALDLATPVRLPEVTGGLLTLSSIAGLSSLGGDNNIEGNLQNAVRAIVTVTEGLLLNDSSGMENFHNNSMAGSYGALFEWIGVAGEFYASEEFHVYVTKVGAGLSR